jgi:hypothetical protein
VCDLFWCASRETRASVKSKDRAEKEERVAREHAKARALFFSVTITTYLFIYIYIYMHTGVSTTSV